MNKTKRLMSFLVALLLMMQVADHTCARQPGPNVILVMTDDQGYGDLACHGNPVLRTPNLDKLHSESVRFTDFHVAPVCTPTRSQLMTGMDAMKTGATFVCQGRSMVRRDIPFLPQYFKEAGYVTGMFGKWHLGDSYPHRPEDRGFDEVLSFRAWGITSLADRWQNNYFNPWLVGGGVYSQHAGYCTDIYFDEAMKWMARRQAESQPFFCYIPTNTPHAPNVVAEKYKAPYRGEHNGIRIPDSFYGMIANIDENIGKLESFLKETGLRENTIVIFLTDNGTQDLQAARIFNAGMAHMKGSTKEGGHRVPLFIRWPQGDLQHGRSIHQLAQVQDILPTLIDLCGLKAKDVSCDGISLVGLLTGKQEKLPQRLGIVQYKIHGGKWHSAAVMMGKWRLLRPGALFNIETDPHQDKNVAEAHPEIDKKMSDFYDSWYSEAKPLFDIKRWIIVGSDQANPALLFSSDWEGGYADNPANLSEGTAKGVWNVIVEHDGDYEFELRRWPEESAKRLTEANIKADPKHESARPIAQAQLSIADFDRTVETRAEDTMVRFTVSLRAGQYSLKTMFKDAEGKDLCGAFYVKVTF